MQVLAGRKGLAAIWIEDVASADLRLSAPSGVNLCADLVSGVVGWRSNVFLNSIRFTDILPSADYQAISPVKLAYNGAAIYTKGNRHSLEQIGSKLGTYFNNCHIGIASDGMHLRAQDNLMNIILERGISTINAKNCNLKIVANEMDAVLGTGIYAAYNDPTLSTLIQENRIAVTSPGRNFLGMNTGILVTEYGSVHASAPIIAYNRIEQNNATTGILLQNTKGYSVRENSIQFMNSIHTKYGINVQTSTLQLNCNDILGQSFSDFPICYGVHTTASVGRYTCNTLEETYRGMVFDGVSSIQVKGNRFGNHVEGLRINVGSSISQQKFNGNRWFYTFPVPAIGLMEAVNYGDPLQSIFIINNPYTEFDPSPKMPSTIGVWFDYQYTTPNFNCNLPQLTCDNAVLPIYSTELEKTDSLLAVDSFTTNAYTDNAAFTGKRQLYRKIQENGLAANNAVFQNFMQQQATASVGRFELLAQQTSDALLVDANTQNMADQLHTQYRERLDTLRDLDSLYWINNNSALEQQPLRL